MLQFEVLTAQRKVLRQQWKTVSAVISEVDTTFLVLRVVSFFAGICWLLLVPYSASEKALLLKTLIGFSLYSIAGYIVIFFRPVWLRKVYIASFFFDIIFLSNLVYSERSFENSFFLGFYLLVCLHTIYFGLRFGLLAATLSAFFYLLSITSLLDYINWTDLAVRIAFLYFITVPLGLLSETANRDKKKVDDLNKKLAHALENIKLMQQKLIDAEKFSALGRLTEDVTNEIKNSMMVVGGLALKLQKNNSAAVGDQEYVAKVINEIVRIEKILADTLVYSNAVEVELKRTEISKPAQSSCASYRALCQEQNIVVEEFYEMGLPNAKIDSVQVQQALDFLVCNAIDAMPEGGVLSMATGHATIHDAPYLTISVSDTGEGIDPEVIQFIFEPFFTTKKVGLGTGLGLTIVKKIMEKHCGFVSVKNDVGRGAEFFLYFPLQSEEQDKMTPCWEYLGCGIETEPSRHCSAYPHFGRICWATAGSVSQSTIAGLTATRIATCRECSFYKSVNSCSLIPLQDG
ncbi:MAG: HAMP domain-containing sensor histidine kinase [Thermodesulfobacteriota bacterium]|jgi:signal transduction histidine kinase